MKDFVKGPLGGLVYVGPELQPAGHTRILNVGCGNKPTGDVNCDLHIQPSVHRRSCQEAYRKALDSNRIPNLVKASCNYLPFKPNCFRVVHCFDVMEHHGVDFYKALKEMLRVARLYILFAVPSIWDIPSNPKNHPGHKYVFTARQLRELLKRFPHDLVVERWGRLVKWIPVYVPYGYMVQVWKAPE